MSCGARRELCALGVCTVSSFSLVLGSNTINFTRVYRFYVCSAHASPDGILLRPESER